MKLTEKLSVDWRKWAGLITFSLTTYKDDAVYYHIFPEKDYQQWGFDSVNKYPFFPSFGLGPLLLICWTDLEEYCI
jgi:hypothetical protein